MVLKRPRGKRGGKKNKKPIVQEVAHKHGDASHANAKKTDGKSSHKEKRDPASTKRRTEEQGHRQPSKKHRNESCTAGEAKKPTSSLSMGLPTPDWSSLSLPEFQRSILRSEIIANQLHASKAELPPAAQQYLDSHKLHTLTPIQSRAWPAALSGKNVLGIAPTGSGKTLAYLIPVACVLAANPALRKHKSCAPRALILAPTRELVQQVALVARGMRKGFGVQAATVYGGVEKESQKQQLTPEVNLLVATPGRLLDLLQEDKPVLSLQSVLCLVLDEADRMLALGFAEQISSISGQVRPDRLVMLFSATMPSSLRTAAKLWLPQPVIEVAVSDQKEAEAESEATAHGVGTEDLLAVSKNVQHEIHVCAPHKRPRLLIRYITRLREGEKAEGARNQSLMLIFCNKIKTVKYVHSFLTKNGQRASAIHGQMAQDRRDLALSSFRSGKTPILVATDVAARGLHIKSLPLIINWDMAPSLAQYVHRCGRTGRQGHESKGRAYTLFTRNFAAIAPTLVDMLNKSGQQVPSALSDLARDSLAGDVSSGNESSGDEEEEEESSNSNEASGSES